jgi:hypothetical protein
MTALRPATFPAARRRFTAGAALEFRRLDANRIRRAKDRKCNRPRRAVIDRLYYDWLEIGEDTIRARAVSHA